jgi:hypothetical protein
MISLVKAVSAAMVIAAPLVAQATPVTVDFSGTVATAGEGYVVGTPFSGQFTYDTGATIRGTGGNFRDFVLASSAFTFNIGGDTLTDSGTNNSLQVTQLGEFAVLGNVMTGTGPLNGGGVFPIFFGSSAPSFNALLLPATFPTDFTSTDMRYFVTIPSSFGPLGSFAQVGIPEPMGLSLIVSGLFGLSAARRKRT